MRAILISGNAYRYTEEQRVFERFLVHEVKVGKNQIKCFRTVSSSASVLMEMHLGVAVRQKSAYPLIVHYIGHGCEEGWAFDDALTVSYEAVAMTLAQARRPVLVVNETCHAMSLAAEFEKQGVDPARTSLICSSEADETTCEWLGDRLRTRWRKRRVNGLSNLFHWGADLDHHFYPRKNEQQEAAT